jgi:hypothetical protein
MGRPAIQASEDSHHSIRGEVALTEEEVLLKGTDVMSQKSVLT